MRGVVVANPGSGGGDGPGPREVAAALGPLGLEVRTVEDPADVPALAREALGAGAEVVGVAGGDGTVRCVAEVLAGTGVAMLVVPAGTRNHFARELGVDTLDAAAAAAAGGACRQVALGSVNDRRFVNNASVGLYPALVRRREHHEDRMAKGPASLVAAAAILRDGEPVEVDLDGMPVPAWMLFVGNGRYGDGWGDLVERDSLESGVLDVRLVRADRRLARTRVAAAVALGRLARTPLVLTEERPALQVGVEGRRVDVALDGEVVTLETPLCFRSEPAALTVLAPPGPAAGH